MNTTQKKPKLRFPEYQEDWTIERVENLFDFKNGLNKEKEFFGKGNPIINFMDVYKNSNLKGSNVKGLVEVDINELLRFNVQKGDVFFTRTSETINDIGMSSALIEDIENCVFSGFVLRARPKTGTFFPEFTGYLFRTGSIRKEISTKSSMTTRALTSGALLNQVEICFPSNLCEQEKIAKFISLIDYKINYLNITETQLRQYKNGVLQKIFSRELRFKNEKGNDFPKWRERFFHEILHEHGLKSSGKEEVFSVSVHKGLINQIEHLGRSYSSKDTSNYNRVLPGDIVYTKSPTGNFPFGIVKQSRIKDSVIVSPLYGVFTPESYWLGYILNVYFESVENSHNYLSPIIQKGAKNTINITNTTFLSRSLRLPTSIEEQEKIASFLIAIDEKIDHCKEQIRLTEDWKKGLLQQMFV